MSSSSFNQEQNNAVSCVTNRTVLTVTTICFVLFVVAEIIAALASNSLSLLGDGAAMSVDAFTYMCNYYAEYTKGKHGGVLSNRTRFILEVCIPTFSVIALLGVTGWITSDAIKVLLDPESGEDVDVNIMFGFAAGNLAVDAISMTFFCLRGPDVLVSTDNVVPTLRTFSFDHGSTSDTVTPLLKNDIESLESEKTVSPKKFANLNMISALTHVCGDTLRSLSVFIAALISNAGAGSGSDCDAWAAVIVTITIVIAIIPLSIEIFRAYGAHLERTKVNN